MSSYIDKPWIQWYKNNCNQGFQFICICKYELMFYAEYKGVT